MNRILFVVDTLYPLGPAHQLLRLARQLADRSWDVHVGVLHWRETDMRTVEAPRWTIHRLGTTPIADPFSRAGGAAIYRLVQLLRTLRPDVLHGWCGMANLVTRAATPKRPRMGRFEAMRCFATELSVPPKKRVTRQWYENVWASPLNATIVCHERLKECLVAEGELASRIEVIPNEIDPPSTDRERSREAICDLLGLPSESVIIGTVAPLLPRYRLKDLIWAIELLTLLRDDCHLLIFGTGSQAWRLKRFLACTECEGHVHFLGEPPESAHLLAGIDFYWQSHLQEPLCVNLLTSMARGLFGIAVAGPGTDEVIRQQETGFRVNFGGRNEWAKWTRYLLEQPESARQLSAQAKAYVTRQFCKSEMAECYLKVYEGTERE